MKVIGLVSGGKDSVYNLILCQQHGHEVVALGNLLPSETGVDELDSYMYQTVGHQLIEAYAQCAGLPLFRRRIRGFSKHKELQYSATEGDEVEDLLDLLAFAKQKIPEIQAVSSGAIASDYQRLRVENVCDRLGLVSLAYLWMQPQAELLQSMIAAKVQAVLVKVAVLGLQPSRHLGQNLQEMQPILHDLNRRFSCNICGEGGEYETLTLDCPLFTEARIVLDSWHVALHSEDSFASVGILHPTAFHTEPKTAAAPATGRPAGLGEIGGSSDWGTVASEARDCSDAIVVEVPPDFRSDDLAPADDVARPETGGAETLEDARFRRSRAFLSGWCMPSCSAEIGTAEALHLALATLQLGLRDHGCSFKDAVLVQLWLKDMRDFAAANRVYKQYFPASRPAARACVEVLLPEGFPLAIQILARAPAAGGEDDRRVLHVQSVSSWAPACIGPYSQAVAAAGLVFFAGQIGLHPPRMTLLPSVPAQVQQCFAGCKAVAVAMRVHLPSSILATVLYSTPQAGEEARRELDNGLQQLLTAAEGEEEEGELRLDSYLTAPAGARRLWEPLATHLVVPALPAGAAVEVQPLCSSAGDIVADSDDSSAASAHEDGRRDWTRALRNQQHADRKVAFRTLASPGRFSIFQASLGRSEAEMRIFTPAGDGTPGEEGEPLSQLLRAVGQALSAALNSARLSSRDILTLHMYVRAELLNPATQSWVESALRAELEASGIGWEQPGLLVVPVVAAGFTAEAESAMLLEVMAWKPAA